MVSGSFLPQKPFQLLTFPTGSLIGAWPTAAKIAVGAAAGTAATVAVLGAKQALEQFNKQQAQTQAASGGYTINVQPGGTANLSGTTTGTAQAETEQTSDQTAEQKQPDYAQLLILGALAIGGLYLLGRRK